MIRSTVLKLVAAGLLGACASAPPVARAVVVPLNGGDSLPGDLYGRGPRGVVLVGHGGYSQRDSWAGVARLLADSGMRVLAFETRGAVALRGGRETACLYDASCMADDVLAAVRSLRAAGARTVTVMGGSAGGGGAMQAAAREPGAIDRLVLLAPMAIEAPERVPGPKLVITARDDLGGDGRPRLPGIQDQFARMPGPKELMVLEGSAHGQRLFSTSAVDTLTGLVLRFLRGT